jgi:molybdenum cofactor cytidylyltransferase
MITALILAAGKSQRLGYPKALLSLGHETFAARLLRLAGEAGVDTCRIVLGYRARDLRRLLQLPDEVVVVNQRYEEGQLVSLQCGLQGLSCDAVLVMPVDHPAISVHVLRQIISRFRLGRPLAVIPTYKGRGGHPTLFSKALFPELLECPPEVGARAVLNRHRGDICYLPTTEPAVIMDVDTADDYRRLLQFHGTEWKQGLSTACDGDRHESPATVSQYCPRCSGDTLVQPG